MSFYWPSKNCSWGYIATISVLKVKYTIWDCHSLFTLEIINLSYFFFDFLYLFKSTNFVMLNSMPIWQFRGNSSLFSLLAHTSHCMHIISCLFWQLRVLVPFIVRVIILCPYYGLVPLRLYINLEPWTGFLHRFVLTYNGHVPLALCVYTNLASNRHFRGNSSLSFRRSYAFFYQLALFGNSWVLIWF